MKINSIFKITRLIAATLTMLVLFASCGTKRKAASRISARTSQQTSTDVKKNTGISSVEKQNQQVETSLIMEETPTFNSPVEAYIWTYAAIAQEEMRLYGIPASITIAQGILESGSGKGNLTMRSNNHFGIKCNGWQGAKVYHDDDEAQECFRKYNDPKYSFRDHSLFLYERPRYAFLFDYKKTDYKSWAKGLRRAGYATDRKYPDKLISLIERYKLYELDDAVINGVPPPNMPEPKNKVDYTARIYQVKSGDTLYRIASRFNLTVDELKTLNQLKTDTITIGQKLYLKPLQK